MGIIVFCFCMCVYSIPIKVKWFCQEEVILSSITFVKVNQTFRRNLYNNIYLKFDKAI